MSVERRGAVAWVLDDADWQQLDADPDVRVIVHTGGRAGTHPPVSTPVVFAARGLTTGAAFHALAAADVVIAASDAEFSDPEVSVTLARKVPFEAVMRMALVGARERVPAARAYELGMVSQVVDPPDALDDAAQALAESIARNSPGAVRATKRALWGALEHGLTDACRRGADELVSMWGHPDQTEGPKAFAEKREPHWEP
jgi:enoyl-CoA hydratase